MVSITITLILVIIIILYFISFSIEPKFLCLIIISLFCLYNLYQSNNIIFDIPLLKKKNINHIFEDKKINIYQFLLKYDDYLIYNPELKNDIYNATDTYVNNLLFIWNNNNIKYCDYYYDIINLQKINIKNLMSSIMITLPALDNYNDFNLAIKEFNILLDDIQSIINYKCSLNKNIYTTNQYKNNNSFEFND